LDGEQMAGEDARRLVLDAPEPGRTLLQEGLHTFSLVRGPEQVQEQVAFYAHAVRTS